MERAKRQPCQPRPKRGRLLEAVFLDMPFRQPGATRRRVDHQWNGLKLQDHQIPQRVKSTHCNHECNSSPSRGGSSPILDMTSSYWTRFARDARSSQAWAPDKAAAFSAIAVAKN